jgi:hypothetical protein
LGFSERESGRVFGLINLPVAAEGGPGEVCLDPSPVAEKRDEDG